MRFELAQVNVSRLLAQLDSPQLAEFVAALDEVSSLRRRRSRVPLSMMMAYVALALIAGAVTSPRRDT